MKTWQAFISSAAIAVGMSFIPGLKVSDETKAAIGASGLGALAVINKKNSNSDPKGKKLIKDLDGNFKTKK
jgi:hypothetical protein